MHGMAMSADIAILDEMAIVVDSGRLQVKWTAGADRGAYPESNG